MNSATLIIALLFVDSFHLKIAKQKTFLDFSFHSKYETKRKNKNEKPYTRESKKKIIAKSNENKF